MAAAKKKPVPAKKYMTPRADLGKPVDGFFAKQTTLKPITDALRALILEAAPDATSSLKWGMPFFEGPGGMIAAIGAHKAHVNLILHGPPGTYPDPEERLTGDGKTGRHLKLTSLDDLPKAAVRGWLKIAAKNART